MVIAANLGFPRIGTKRELKRALERYWAKKIDGRELLEVGRTLRESGWKLQQQNGIHHIPSNDFSLYDHVLDTAAMVGAVPAAYDWSEESVSLETYFAMARGRRGENGSGVPAMEMTKWFDTNYHYLVPELAPEQEFRLASTKPVDEFKEAKALGILTRPVLLGPVSFLILSKARDGERRPRPELLPRLLPVYESILGQLAREGAEWVQMDEPGLVLDLEPEHLKAYQVAYERLSAVSKGLRLLLTTYFGDLRASLRTIFELPVAGVHLDLVRAPGQLEETLPYLRQDMYLSLGLVDGRNIWRNDLTRSLAIAAMATERVPRERLMVAPSCSLLHVPLDLGQETGLDAEIRSWLAFGKQKLQEVVFLGQVIDQGVDSQSARETLGENLSAWASRRTSTRVHQESVKRRLAGVERQMLRRGSPFAQRLRAQRQVLGLPRFPTTTIGSFPQTAEVRQLRADHARGKIGPDDYVQGIRREIEAAIRFQEEVDLDVLVHGEFERSDMVEYFAEQMTGIVGTEHGWVQSYGSRCVKPPIIYGDVARIRPMTVQWWEFAQQLTPRPVKGMLAGPVTILQWSFVRDDQPRRTTCFQIAFAIRDEVEDLERAGCRVIQIDEPAFREGLPLRRADWPEYLSWAVDAFRLASTVVRDSTQIHSHMCYAEFNDIIEHVAALDADVISVEASRSQMDLLDAFVRFRYPNQIGPGVWDIHSPRVPSAAEMQQLLRKALEVLSPEQIWVNPDCGLKTRSWAEVKLALAAMTSAARQLRE